MILVSLMIAFALAVVILVSRQIVPTKTDFRVFYESGLAWRTHKRDLREGTYPNLNPPTLSPVLAPLTLVPFPVAFLLWNVLGLLAIGDTLRLIVRHRALPKQRVVVAAALLFCGMPGLSAWVTGQLTWILMYLLTRAWTVADRSPRSAGLWLAIAVAIKPPLALLALFLPRTILLVTVLVSAAITGSTMLITGWAPWADWLALSHKVSWLGWPLNASLWGTVARLESPKLAISLADLRHSQLLVVVTALAILFVSALRVHGDRKWVLGFYWSLLASPLGWLYYLPVALGPILATWQTRNGLAWVALTLTAIPVQVLLPLAVNAPSALAINSIYGIGLGCAWLAWLLPASEASASHTLPSQPASALPLDRP